MICRDPLSIFRCIMFALKIIVAVWLVVYVMFHVDQIPWLGFCFIAGMAARYVVSELITVFGLFRFSDD